MQSQLRGYPNLAGKPYGRDGAMEARLAIDELVRNADWNPARLNALVVASYRESALPVILSNESLIEMPQREWFDNFVGPFEIAQRLARLDGERRVFMTLRESRSMLRSTWLHHVREGRVQQYSDFLRRITDDRSAGRGPFSIGALADAYGELFGIDRVVVAFSEDFTSDPDRFWRRFVEVFDLRGFEPSLADQVPRLNATTLGPIGFELAANRALNLYGSISRRESTRPIRRWLTRHLSVRIRTDHHRFFGRFSGIEDPLVSAITADVSRVRARFTVL